MRLLKPFALLLAALLASPCAPALAGGRLVIAGGALSDDNAAVYEAFVEALPAAGKVVIVPAASGSPAWSADYMTGLLQRYGVAPERLESYPVAVRDDETTPEVDESLWGDGAWDTDRVTALGEPAGFWFTGGDQIRTMEALARADGEASPLLALVRARLAAGAVVGGSSAGAAIMGRHMIAGGESVPALLEAPNLAYASTDEENGGRLLLTRGAGFLPAGLVDQHFGVRARLGRLVRALGETGESFGYGVGEDTALMVDLASGQATVLGRGGVTLLDASGAEFDFGSQQLARGLRIGYAAPGARFPLGRCELGGDIGTATRGSEAFDHAAENAGGMAFAHRGLEDLLGPDLLDNAVSGRLQRFSMRDDGSLLIYAFEETPESTGYRTAGDGPTRYSTCKVRFDVTRAAWEIADSGR